MGDPPGRVRPCAERDFAAVLAVVNDGAAAYRGVIPADCWQEPYMPEAELRHEVEAGVAFWGYEQGGTLAGVMGLQELDEVTLIRHAYVRAACQRRGIGGLLLRTLLERAPRRPVLVGTWADARWAVRFYERHGFRLLPTAEKDRLLRRHWTISARQREASVVLRLDGP